MAYALRRSQSRFKRLERSQVSRYLNRLHELFSKKRLNRAILTHSQLESRLHTRFLPTTGKTGMKKAKIYFQKSEIEITKILPCQPPIFDYII
jgi:hypothetical protein